MSAPQMPQPEPRDYFSRPAGPASLSRMAIWAMVLGIIAIPTGVVGIGILLGIVALILGIISLISINNSMGQKGGKGFAIAGIVTGGIAMLITPVLALMIAILLPSLGKARELSNRSVCAANLRGTMQSLNVYAADNSDAYPIVSPTGGYALAAGGSGSPAADPVVTIQSMYATPAPSVTQNLWLLVLNGQVAPKQFVCKSDPASFATASSSNSTGQFFVNFNDGTAPSDMSYSYSFAYPWIQTPPPPGQRNAIGGWWRNATDASLPLMADLSPMTGTGSPVATPSTYTNRASNSFNHQRDGQNVGFGDAHAEFSRNPAVGQSNDNIFTSGGGFPTPGGTQLPGTVPNIGNGGAPGAWDITLVPAVDGATHARR